MIGNIKIKKNLIIFILAFLCFIANQVSAVNDNQANSVNQTKKSEVEKNIEDVLDEEDLTELQEQILQDEAFRNIFADIQDIDPTKPRDVTSPDKEEIQKRIKTGLTAIINFKNRNVAIIDGQIVKDGDRLNGKDIIKIFKNKVQIKEEGKVKELFLPDIKVKSKENAK